MNDTHFSPPPDRLFQDLMHRAVQGGVPVYGVVIEVGKVAFRRSAESFRPETMEHGQAVLRSMTQAWQSGDAAQPWLYVRDGAYIVADDYLWLALVERGNRRPLPPRFWESRWKRA